MARSISSSTRKVVGLGFLPEEARHGFLIDIPKGIASGDKFALQSIVAMIWTTWAFAR